MEIKKDLKIRKKAKKKKPEFKRQEYTKKKRLETKWVRPRGRHSKLRLQRKARGSLPGPGYSSPASVKGLNPSGFAEVIVHRPVDLDGLDPKTQIAVISSGVGQKKRNDIKKQAEAKGVKISNA
ncbi:MAG: 50S ribosomal protein L32e [Candidatus Aenigmatarchaeota archaeon]